MSKLWIRKLFSRPARRPIRKAFLQLPLALETLEDRCVPSAVTVSNASDIVNGNTGSIAALIATPGADGISLREAITAANNTGGADTISFSSGMNGSTIILSTVGGTRVGPSAFQINSDITVTGFSDSSGITLSAAGTAMRLFDVVPTTGKLTLQNLTLSGGSAQGFNGGNSDAGAAGGGSAGLGGAIFNQGTLTIVNSTLTGNTAAGGSGGTRRTGSQFFGGAGGAGLGANGVSPTYPATGFVGFAGGGPNPGAGGTGGSAGGAGGLGGGGGGGAGGVPRHRVGVERAASAVAAVVPESIPRASLLAPAAPAGSRRWWWRDQYQIWHRRYRRRRRLWRWRRCSGGRRWRGRHGRGRLQ